MGGLFKKPAAPTIVAPAQEAPTVQEVSEPITRSNDEAQKASENARRRAQAGGRNATIFTNQRDIQNSSAQTARRALTGTLG